jgi:hypothetical protein
VKDRDVLCRPLSEVAELGFAETEFGLGVSTPPFTIDVSWSYSALATMSLRFSSLDRSGCRSINSGNQVSLWRDVGRGLPVGCITASPGVVPADQIGKHKAIVFLANVLPSQCQDFVEPRAREGEQANRRDHPRRAALIVVSLSQRGALFSKARPSWHRPGCRWIPQLGGPRGRGDRPGDEAGGDQPADSMAIIHNKSRTATCPLSG